MSTDTKPRNLGWYIDGRFISGRANRQVQKISPVDGSLLALIDLADDSDVDEAVCAAHRALSGPWRTLSTEERLVLLHHIADEIDRRHDDFLAAEIHDTGKPRALAKQEISRAADNFRSFAAAVSQYRDEIREMPTPDGGKAVNRTLRAPKGVIAAIGPWNVPLLTMTWKIAPALAWGNTVVAKPSQEAATTTLMLAEVMQAVGIPPGVFNVIHGGGGSLTAHPKVAAISMTGSSYTGSVIMKAVAPTLKDCAFELGGKNAALVFADCNFLAAVQGTAQSCFRNTGQICLGTERVYVHQSIFSEFVAALKAEAERLKPGLPDAPGTTFGPLISHSHRVKVLEHYASAVAEGATIVTGGGIPEMPGTLQKGAWIQPTVWTGLPESARVVQEEVFGPCCHVAPFDTEEEVLRLARHPLYGLAASIWTRDLAKADRVAQALEVGVCWINTWLIRDLTFPFGGSKQSGIGREGGLHSKDFFTELRYVCTRM